MNRVWMVLFALGMITLPRAGWAQARIRFVTSLNPSAGNACSGRLIISSTIQAAPCQLHLPVGHWTLMLRPSLIKASLINQTKPKTSLSPVSVLEGQSDDAGEAVRVWLVLIRGSLQHLVLQKGDQLYQLDPTEDGQFLFSNQHQSPSGTSAFCPLPNQAKPSARPVNARKAVTGCRVVKLALVTDLSVGNTRTEETEAKLLAWVAATQAYFDVSFDTALRLQVSALFIPTKESPFPADWGQNFGDVNSYMKQWLNKQGFSTGQVDVTVGLTGANYQTGTFLGYTFNDPLSLGTIMMKIQPNLTVALLTHELGHVFGASHDAQDFTYVMSPTVTGNSGRWSQQSKDAINAFLTRPEITSRLRECPTLVFNAADSNQVVHLQWEASYEEEVAAYVVSFDAQDDGRLQVLDTLPAKGNPQQASRYHWVHTTPRPGRNIYWLTQLSRSGAVLSRQQAVVTVKLDGGSSRPLVRISPSPFVDKLQIELTPQNQALAIYDAAGRLWFKQVVNSNTVIIPTSHWPGGVYVVRVDDQAWRVVK
jgi:hypothetical protein